MSRLHKKTKSVKDLSEKKDQLESLKKSVLAIYLTHSEEELLRVIKKQLPALCKVDFIELSHDCQKIKKAKYIYSYSFTYKDKNYFIHFHKADGLAKTEKWFLNKVGQALESVLIRIEEYKELKISKEQWELAFDTIATPICLTDLQGHILRTNKTFREKTKLSKTELLQKDYFTAFFGKAEDTTAFQSHKEKRREKLLVDGQERDFEISLQKILQNTENEIQLVILRDITKQIKIEHKIAQSAKSAELGIISSSIAHELNNPIAGIHALLQTIQMQKTDENLTEDLKEMSLAIQRCIHIINQLLDIHR